MTERRWLGALLAVIVGSVLLRAPFAGGRFFRGYDDGILIVDNPVVGRPSWAGLGQLFSENFRGEAQNGMHVVNLVSMAIFGDNYAAFAWTNLVVLGVVVGLAYLLTGAFIADRRYQIAVAAMFGAHNLLTDTAAWMAARGHFLGLPFAIIGLYLWTVRVRRDGRAFWGFTALAVGAVFVATWMKIYFFSLFLLVVALDVCRAQVQRRVVVSWALPALGFGFFAYWDPLYTGWSASVVTDRAPTIYGRTTLLVEHLYAAVMPQQTSIVVQHTVPHGWWDMQATGLAVGWAPPALWAVFLVGLLLGAAALSLAVRRWEVVYFVGAALVILLPSLPWRRVEPGLAFEFRYTILPALCLLVAAAVLAQAVAARWPQLERAFAALAAVFVVSHGAMSARQAMLLADHEAYWFACVDRFPVTAICFDLAGGAKRLRDDDAAMIAWLEQQSQAITRSGLLRDSGVDLRLAALYEKSGDDAAELLAHERSLTRGRLRPEQVKQARRRIAVLRTKLMLPAAPPR